MEALDSQHSCPLCKVKLKAIDVVANYALASLLKQLDIKIAQEAKRQAKVEREKRLHAGRGVEDIFSLDLKESLLNYYGVDLDQEEFGEKEVDQMRQNYERVMYKLIEQYDKHMAEIIPPLQLKIPSLHHQRDMSRQHATPILRKSRNIVNFRGREVFIPAVNRKGKSALRQR